MLFLEQKIALPSSHRDKGINRGERSVNNDST